MPSRRPGIGAVYTPYKHATSTWDVFVQAALGEDAPGGQRPEGTAVPRLWLESLASLDFDTGICGIAALVILRHWPANAAPLRIQ